MDLKEVAKAISIGLVGGALGLAVAPLIQEPIVKINPLNEQLVKQNKELNEELIKLNSDLKELQQKLQEKPKEVIKYINKTVVKEVPVDNKNLDKVLDYLISGENISLITDGLDKEDIDKIVERINFINDSEALAESYLKSRLINKVDGEVVNGIVLDGHYIERIEIDSVDIKDIDFKYKDAIVFINGTFEQFNKKYQFNSTVFIKNNNVYGIQEVSVKEI